MSSHHLIPTIHFAVGADKVDAKTRCDRGVKVAKLGPQSPLYAVSEVKTCVDDVATVTALLKAASDTYSTARQGYLKARTALGTAVIGFDLSYGVLVTTAAKHCATVDDGAGLGLEPRTKTINPLAMPILVLITFNVLKDLLRIHVKRAKGMRAVSVQVTQDPTNAASWKELDGDGAVHLIHNPAPGAWWARAASKTARAKSDYTTPVTATVK